ncbi:uncharacterized protein LOC127003769 isoform X2 [Eriocheir sinensis]|uniref:uncharacterized protein LOC127003769 isoform X2 n=1 Tax=Eriocheir sinensis TaxID=95602 RepID=UPI0021C717E8|nr:uncharacterized protein LOC127003769 isoform X2 [Eriocheir sinensis]
MHITGAGGEGGGGDGAAAGEDTLTPFLTPQHFAKTPAQSFYSVVNSRDSLDMYHDAYSTLQRQPPAAPTRERHASAGINGHALEMEVPTRAHDGVPHPPTNGEVSGRARHASYSSTQQPATNPHCMGRLSLSSASLKRASIDSPRLLPAPPRRTDSSPLNQQKTPNWRQSYRPCVEIVQEGFSAVPQSETDHSAALGNFAATKPSYKIIENNNDDGWRRNYVECVEGRSLLLGENGGGGGGISSEVQLTPGHLKHLPPKDAKLKMYSFAPVQRRGMSLERVRDEFRVENLYLEHKVPHLFVSSQWQEHNRMSCLYLGYRLFWALYFTMWAVWAWVGSMGYDSPPAQKLYFMTYLTNWSIWTLALDTSIQAVNVVLHLKKISDDGEVMYPSMPRLMKVSWVLSNMMGTMHIFITLGYWTLVYPYRNDETLNEIGINTHIMPGVYILLDVAVSATPRRLLHAYHPMLFIIVYALFNLTYYLCGGTDYLGRPALYPIMDWTRPGPTVGIVLVVIFGLIPFLHGILCGLCAARVKLWRNLKVSRYATEEDEMDHVDGSQEQKV